MASQVLSGTGNVSYTNNTGQNVRVIINYISCSSGISLAWGPTGARGGTGQTTIGRNLAFYKPSSSIQPALTSNNAVSNTTSPDQVALPTEIMLAPGQIFRAFAVGPTFPYQIGAISAYNIVVIPESG